MTRFSQCFKPAGLAAVQILLVAVQAHAIPIVVPIFTDLGDTFQYDYSITNDPPGEDLVLVDIHVLPNDATLTNLFAPADFQAIYDSGLGLVSFLPGLGSPAVFAPGTTLSGFGFESAFAPRPSTFDALDVLGNTTSGPTLAPLGPADSAIPEPGTTVLLTLGLGVLARRAAVRRRKCPCG